ncbi:MAG: methyltransferase family protein [Rhizomicrobium sp.]
MNAAAPGSVEVCQTQAKVAANFRSTKTYDVLIATPLVLYYGFALVGLKPQFEAALRFRPMWLSALQLSSLACFAFYLALVIALVFLRRMPVAKSDGVWPRALALLASNWMSLLVWLPPAAPSTSLIAISAALTAGGTFAELFILVWLGRCFSVLPEARGLVTRGPYRHIRHPVYLSSLVVVVGVMLHFQQTWAFLIVVPGFALQIWRMHYEEQVLRRTFPDYAAYAARSWRLVPGVY